MKAKVETNIDKWSEDVYTELKVGKEYEVTQVVISGWSTRVYLENGRGYNSTLFDKKFQRALSRAINKFNSNDDSQIGDTIGVFVRDYY